MTENTHHDPAALDKLAEPFTVLPNDNLSLIHISEPTRRS